MANPPPAPNVTLWRNLIGMLYNHPGIVVHPEMAVLQNLFHEMGTSLQCHAIQIRIPVDESQFGGPQSYARPIVFPEFSKLQLIFGDVEECQLDPERKEMVVSKYSLCASLRIGMSEMVDFIRRLPEALYYEMYAFLYDFLLRFGVPPGNVEKFVNDSKLKRAASAVTFPVFPGHHSGLPQGQPPDIEIKYDPAAADLSATSAALLAAPGGSFILKSVKWGENDIYAAGQHPANTHGHGHDVYSSPQTSHSQVGDYSKLQLHPRTTEHMNDNGTSASNSINNPAPGNSTTSKPSSGPTMCPICELTFSRRRSMQQHLRSKHPDQAPPKPVVQKKLQTKHIKCPCCETHFTYRRSLVFHLRQKHPGHELPGVKSYSRVDVERRKRVDCPHPICTVRFTRKSSMIHHFKNKHPNDKLPSPPSSSSQIP